MDTLAQLLIPAFTLLHLMCTLTGGFDKASAWPRIVDLAGKHGVPVQLLQELRNAEAWDATWQVAVMHRLVVPSLAGTFYVSTEWKLHGC